MDNSVIPVFVKTVLVREQIFFTIVKLTKEKDEEGRPLFAYLRGYSESSASFSTPGNSGLAICFPSLRMVSVVVNVCKKLVWDGDPRSTKSAKASLLKKEEGEYFLLVREEADWITRSVGALSKYSLVLYEDSALAMPIPYFDAPAIIGFCERLELA